MYGKVYKIEGDETSTEAATRLWVTFAKYSIWATIWSLQEQNAFNDIFLTYFVSSAFQFCLRFLWRPSHEVAGWCQQPSRLWGRLQSLSPYEETGFLTTTLLDYLVVAWATDLLTENILTSSLELNHHSLSTSCHRAHMDAQNIFFHGLRKTLATIVCRQV